MPTSAKPGASRFVPNPMFPEELKRATFLIDDMGSVAEDLKDEIVAGAPVAEGAFRESFAVESGIDNGEATGRVLTTDRKAYFIEFGDMGDTFDHPIRSGIERAGYSLEDTGA